MTSLIRRLALTALSTGLLIRPAASQQLQAALSEPISGREAIMASVIAAMMLCGLCSFALLGRVSERTHVALAMLSALAGAFGFMVLCGSLLYSSPVAAVLGFALLIGMFKLMSQFEGAPKPDRNTAQRVAGYLLRASRRVASRFRG